MKYILRNDICYFFRELKKITCIYIGVLLSYILYLKVIHYPPSVDNFYQALGLNFDIQQFHPVIYILFGIYICYYMLIIIKLFFKDMEFNSCNIFLRLKHTKWYIYKIASIITITVLTRLFFYISIVIFMNTTGILNSTFIVNIFFVDIIWLLLIQQLFLFLYFASIKHKMVVLLVLGVIFLINNGFFTNVLFVSENFIYCLLALLILFMSNYFIYKKIYIEVIEAQQY